MAQRSFVYTCARTTAVALTLLTAVSNAAAATISVPAGGDLQAALDAANPGDTILLAPGATYVGNFVLPVHGGTTYVTIRTAGNDALLPPAGVRITPAHAPYLAKLQSPNWMAALSTAPNAAYWRVMLLEFRSSMDGNGDIMKLGDGSPAQNTLSLVPHHLIVDRVYMHGDPVTPQKRGIALNSATTTIINSHIDDIKYTGQDSQAIAGANGPGPFTIENNYLEAAGNVFIYGGADPKIAGLVPADLLFRGNTLTRPVSWRNPIMPVPPNVSASPGNGGTLPAGTYGYRVVARRGFVTSTPATATSIRSVEVTATTGANGSVTVRWNPVPYATEYRVYGRTVGGQTMYWTVQTTSFTDTGAGGDAGTPPTSGTVWQVKNLFELKNLRRATVDFNVMENNWQQAQSGIAILLTVRNQDGACTQCIVEDVTFEYNIVRNMGGGITILGEDYNHPSQQANNIVIRNNEFSGLDSSIWGGNGYFLKISEAPRDVTIDHNTIISPRGSGVVTVSGPPVVGFVYTNNLARHNSYGIQGTGQGYGNTAINYYLPGADIDRNVFAGGSASRYPPGNLFPTTAQFETYFVDYGGGDYALVPNTDWAGACSHGGVHDLGADYTMLRRPAPAGPPQVVTTSLPSATALEPYSATLEATAGALPYSWSIMSGSLPAGLTLDSSTGIIAGTASTTASAVFTVRVTDSAGASDTQPLTLNVDPAVAPVQILTSAIAGAIAGVPYVQSLEATGGSGSYHWTRTAGSLPSGISLSTSGDLAGTATVDGTWTFTVTVRDVETSARQASRTFALVVSTQVNSPPAVTVTAIPTGVVQVGATVTLTANATDADGIVARVDFFVNGQAAGSDTSAPFTLAWVARSGGPFSLTATAIDNAGASTTSAAVSLATTAEVVIYAADVVRIVGDYQLVADTTAAAGQRLLNPNRSAAKILTASAAPANFAEFTFYAEAGRPYRLWLRGKGASNHWSNDSAFLQFSQTVDVSGAATYRIGTTGATWYSVEEYNGAGISNWGWQDNGFGLNVVGPSLYFAQTGLQTLRIQQREDGLSIDQIVISPSQYFALAPGLAKNDATIVSKP